MILTALTPKQKAAWTAVADHRMVICDGSVRSGKSLGADIAWLDMTRHAPDGNLLMAGKTERTLKRNVIDPLIEILGNKRCRLVAGSGELFICGRRVYLVGANDERAEEKIRGLTLVGAYIDEASTIPESFWTMLLSRLSLEGARLIATTNPDSPAHWLKVNYLDRAAELGIARFQFRLPDNPYLPASFVEAIGREYTGLWRKRLIEGEWCVAEGAVYEQWDPARHVVPAAELTAVGQLLALGIDYGDTAPTRGILLGASGGRLVAVDEWHPVTGLTQPQLAADLKAWLRGRDPQWLCVDPAAAGFMQQLRHDDIGQPVKAFNAVLSGIRLVAGLLATDRLVVSDACTELIKEMPSYRWDPKATAKGEDKPLKQNDHAVDALRYAVSTTYQLWQSLVPLSMPVDLEEEEAA